MNWIQIWNANKRLAKRIDDLRSDKADLLSQIWKTEEETDRLKLVTGLHKDCEKLLKKYGEKTKECELALEVYKEKLRVCEAVVDRQVLEIEVLVEMLQLARTKKASEQESDGADHDPIVKMEVPELDVEEVLWQGDESTRFEDEQEPSESTTQCHSYADTPAPPSDLDVCAKLNFLTPDTDEEDNPFIEGCSESQKAAGRENEFLERLKLARRSATI
jgi:hypothetical protein